MVAHSQRAHATLAPSSAYRWLKCPGSVRLCQGVEETPSIFAAEGTAAHQLAERCMREGKDARAYRGEVIEVEGNKFTVDLEMVDGVQLYLDVVRELKAESDEFEIETRMDMSALVPGVFGTGDAIAFREKPTRRVTIVDLKYGKGVAVDVEHNEQELTYATGVVQRFHNRGVDEVELVIVQPRAPRPGDSPPGVRRWTTDIVTLFEHVMALQDAAKAADDPNAAFVTGDHCKFCKRAGTCKALRNRVMEITMQDPALAPYKDWKTEQADIELCKTWAKRREEFAHTEALRGRLPPGSKLVGKRANRKWRDENEAVATLQLLGVPDDDIWETSVRSPAQVEKALPKNDRKVIEGLSIKAPSGTVLAPLDDPRPALDPNDARGFEVMEIA